MVFESFAHVPVTQELLQHVWEGEQDSTKGGHRYGLGRLFKTEFPQSWNREHVHLAILKTLSRPQFINRQSRFILCDREIENVIVRVVIAEFICINTFTPYIQFVVRAFFETTGPEE